MPTRGFLMLAIVTTVVVVLCWAAIDMRYQETSLGQQEGGLVFPGLQSQVSTVADIEVTRAGSRFALSRRGNGWANMGVGGYPARAMLVDQVMTALAGLRYITPKTERSHLHPKLGVEDVTAGVASTRVAVKNAAGAVLADVIIGKPKKGGGGSDPQGVYIRLPGDQRAWLAEGSPDVHYDAVDWSDREVIDIDASGLTVLTLRHADGDIVALRRDRPQDPKLGLKATLAGADVRHQFQIDYMAGLFETLRFDDAKPASADDNEAPSAFDVTAQSKAGLTVSLRAGEPAADGSVWAMIEAQVVDTARTSDQTKREAARIKADFGGWTIKLPRKTADRLKIRLIDIIGPRTNNEGPRS